MESTRPTQMAKLRTRHNAEEVLEALTNDSGIPVSIPAISCASTPAPMEASIPAQTLALAQFLTFASGPTGIYTDVDLQKATRLALESFVRD